MSYTWIFYWYDFAICVFSDDLTFICFIYNVSPICFCIQFCTFTSKFD